MNVTKKMKDVVSTFDQELATRIAYVVKQYGSQRKVADKIGITHNQLYRWSKGLATPNFKSMVDLAHLTGVSVDFLATGYDALADKTSYINLKPIDKKDKNEPDEDRVAKMNFHPKWLKSLGLNAENAAIFEAEGDSMEPMIKNEATLLVKLDDGDIKDGSIYVIQMGKQFFVKRLKRNLKNIHIISDNEQYEAQILSYQELEEGELKIIGRVVWYGSHL